MSAKIIDGQAIAAAVREEWKGRADVLRQRGIVPGLAVVMAGNHSASNVYVRNKTKACAQIGLHSEIHGFPTDVDEEAVLARIQVLNANPSIHGILVQLPLPPHMRKDKVLDTISVEKDVDGSHCCRRRFSGRGSAVLALYAVRCPVSAGALANPDRGA